MKKLAGPVFDHSIGFAEAGFSFLEIKQLSLTFLRSSLCPSEEKRNGVNDRRNDELVREKAKHHKGEAEHVNERSQAR